MVAHDIPDNSVVVGNPCKIICTFEDLVEREKKKIMESVSSESNQDTEGIGYSVVKHGVHKKFIMRDNYF